MQMSVIEAGELTSQRIQNPSSITARRVLSFHKVKHMADAKTQFGVQGTFTGTASSTAVGPSESVMVILEAGNATIDVECQPPGPSTSWVKMGTEGIGLDASADVVKVYEAPACQVRLTCTAYTADTNYWLIAR